MRIIYQICLADFRERTRRYSFVLTMLGVLFFGYLVITGKYTVMFGDRRPIYDSVWAGTAMAVCGSIMLAIAGFYLVRGAVKRDRRTQVGQILAATPMGRWTYLLGKFASNVLVLWVIMGTLAAVALGTLLVRNEAGGLNLWQFAFPFLIIAMPAMMFVGAVAVLFDTVRWLQGSLGNIIYLFLAEFTLVLGMLEVSWLDLGAIAAFTDSARAAAAVAFPGEKIGLIIGFVMFDEAMQFEKLRTFPWEGIDWTIRALLMRASWAGAALATIAVAVPAFDRFDPAHAGRRARKQQTSSPQSSSVPESGLTPIVPQCSDIPVAKARFHYFPLVLSELRLSLRGFHWFWFLVAAGLAVAQVAAPFDIVRQYILPGSMVWPLVAWSAMGTRESQHGTSQLVFSSPHPVNRQLTALLVSGVLISLAAVAPMLVRASAAGMLTYAVGLLSTALFVPSAALLLGTLTGSRKMFEVLYLAVWYIGSIDKIAPIDLLGTTDFSLSVTRPYVLVVLAVGCLLGAVVRRRAQIYYT